MPRSTGVRGDLQIAFINGPQVPRQADGRPDWSSLEARPIRAQQAHSRTQVSGRGEFRAMMLSKASACFPPKISDRHPPQSQVMGSLNPRLSDLSVSWPVTPQKPAAGSAWRGTCGPLMKAICRSPRGSTNQSAPFITDSNSSARPLQLTAEWTA